MCYRSTACFKVYWPTMFADTDRWLAQCEHGVQLPKGDYTEPKTLQGSLVANQLLELLCIDFTKAIITKGGGVKRTSLLSLIPSLSIVRHL